MTEPLLGLSAPVFTVGGELSRDLGRDCVFCEVDEGIEGLRTLSAHFVAVGAGATGPPDPMLYLDGQVLDFGKPVQVSLGPDGGQRTVFDGTISAIEVFFADGQPPRVIVLAEDALMRLRMTRRHRSYLSVTDADIAGQLAAEHGLQTDIGVDGPRYDVVQQLNQSDLAFLRERARLLQAELWCTGRTLHFRSRPQRTATAVTLVQGNELLSVKMRADLAHQRSAVRVTGYDAGSRSVIDEQAGPETIDAEIGTGRTGPRVVASALGAATAIRVREAALTGSEASAWAKAEMLRRARQFVTAVGTTRGTVDMVVGSRLRLELVGPPFEGNGYYVTRVKHTFELQQGLRTRFEAERSTVNEVA
ncbi:phage late control D family protein [Jatrophihabitans sp.]|jgi:phage protein D|uniref:phage late control D family protein n=1 Tax=Jatrophihabitans sp. TaxID=1932789 RepID=UPI002EDC7FBE